MTGAQTHINANQDLPELAKRIERLEGERADINKDISEVFREVKGKGFSKKALKEALKLLKKDSKDREEMTDTVQYYMEILEGKK